MLYKIFIIWFLKRYFLGIGKKKLNHYKIGRVFFSRVNKNKWIVKEFIPNDKVYVMMTENGEMKDRVPAALMLRYYTK